MATRAKALAALCWAPALVGSTRDYLNVYSYPSVVKPEGESARNRFLLFSGTQLSVFIFVPAPDDFHVRLCRGTIAFSHSIASATLAPTLSPTATAAVTQTPTPRPTATPTPTPGFAETSTLTVLGIPQELEVTVARVIDGDTFEIESGDGNRDLVRLLGVDTPETKAPNKPNEYGEITDIACLDVWGRRAAEFAAIELEGQTVKLVFEGRTLDELFSFGRLLAFVIKEGKNFNALLIERGLARVFTEEPNSKEAEFLELQQQAQVNNAGLWVCRDSTPTAGSHASPTPTTRTAAPTTPPPTLVPTHTPTPTSTPSPTLMPTPTSTPTPTASPTPVPTSTPFANTPADRNTFANTYADRNTFANTYADRNAFANTYADRNTFATTYADRNAFTNTYADRNAFANTYVYATSLALANTHADFSTSRSVGTDRMRIFRRRGASERGR